MQQRQYWDLELKNQSKRRMELVGDAIARFDAIVHDRYEEKHFSGNQQWRNPLHLRISLPKGKKYEFILATKVSCWLFEPPKVGIESSFCSKPSKLKADHDALRFKSARTFRLHPVDHAYVKNHRNGKVLEGSENVSRVLNGELDLLID